MPAPPHATDGPEAGRGRWGAAAGAAAALPPELVTRMLAMLPDHESFVHALMTTRSWCGMRLVRSLGNSAYPAHEKYVPHCPDTTRCVNLKRALLSSCNKGFTQRKVLGSSVLHLLWSVLSRSAVPPAGMRRRATHCCGRASWLGVGCLASWTAPGGRCPPARRSSGARCAHLIGPGVTRSETCFMKQSPNPAARGQPGVLPQTWRQLRKQEAGESSHRVPCRYIDEVCAKRCYQCGASTQRRPPAGDVRPLLCRGCAEGFQLARASHRLLTKSEAMHRQVRITSTEAMRRRVHITSRNHDCMSCMRCQRMRAGKP